jgi:hypothetical protein
VAITRRGAATDYAARFALPRFGLQPERDVLIVPLEGNPEILAGLEIHSYLLAEELLDLGVECEVLARPVRKETPPERRVGRILVRHLGIPGQLKGLGPKALLPLSGFAVRYSAWLVRNRKRYDVAFPLGSKTPAIPGLVANLLTGLPLVVVSRLARPKGILMLARLWPDIAARHPDAHLVLVGGGGESFDDCEAEVRAFVAEAGIGGRVALAGRIEDVPPWLQAADAFLFPSDAEGFGLVLLEAMACGLPVVSTAVGAAPEVIGPDLGRVVPPKDPAALAAAIEDLYAARERWPAMGAAAREAVVERYGMSSVAARYAQVLRQVARSGRISAGLSRAGP